PARRDLRGSRPNRERRRGDEQDRVVSPVLRIETRHRQLTLGREVTSDRLRILDEPASIRTGDAENGYGDPRQHALVALLGSLDLDQIDNERVERLHQVSGRLVRDLRVAKGHRTLSADELAPLNARERIIDRLAVPRGSETNIAWARRRHGHTEHVAGHHSRRHLSGKCSGGARRRSAEGVAGGLNDESHSLIIPPLIHTSTPARALTGAPPSVVHRTITSREVVGRAVSAP